MRRLSAVLLAIAGIAPCAPADWRVISSESERSAGANAIEHRHIGLEDSSQSQRATIELCLFPTKLASLRVIDNAHGSDSLAEAMTRENCVAGVNGGYFDPQFKPIGLRIIGGRVTAPFIRARLLTGVLCGSTRGIEVMRLGEFSRRRKLDAAIECGPFLIDAGARVRGLDQRRSARRTFAGIARGGNATLGVSSEVTLAQLADALSSVSGDFKISRAINLDGGSSSAFWFRRAGASTLSISEEKSVRDFVGVVPR